MLFFAFLDLGRTLFEYAFDGGGEDVRQGFQQLTRRQPKNTAAEAARSEPLCAPELLAHSIPEDCSK